jgi:hypothetical protein
MKSYGATENNINDGKPPAASPSSFAGPTFQLQPFAASSQTKTYILLESLSTFQTFLIFLLPYLVFFISSTLDSSASLYSTKITLPPPPSPPPFPFTYSTTVSDIPVLSSFLRADATYSNVTQPVLNALVAGTVNFNLEVTSAAQKIYATAMKPLPIVCHSTPTSGLYDCSSPRLLDVLFAAPGSEVLASSTATISITYNGTSTVSDEVLAELFGAASYDVEHESQTYDSFQSTSRAVCFAVAAAFTVAYALFTRSALPSTSSKPEFWFMSPTTLVPERRYVLLILISLLFLLNPVQIVLHHITTYSPALLFASDIVTNAGIYAFLFSWLCLMSGLKHHCADALQDRARHQRRHRVDRETQEHLVQLMNSPNNYSSNNDNYHNRNSNKSPSADLPTNHLVLRHDPNSQFFSDFMAPKLLLLILSLISLIGTLLLRYPVVLPPSLDPAQQKLLPSMYLGLSVLQLLFLVIWIAKITYAAVQSGRILKDQSFFLTRYAQLAYRVCANVMFLALLVTTIPAMLDLVVLFNKWDAAAGKKKHNGGASAFAVPGDAADGDDSTMMTRFAYTPAVPLLQTFIRAITAESSHIPFCASATSIPPGKMIFITVCCVTVGLVFFRPPRSNDGLTNQSGDRRCVVNLARSTHTWRIFPLSISNESSGKLSAAAKLSDKSSSKTTPTYSPVFCNEIACWLLECSWQSYYSSKGYSSSADAPGRMNLESLGLTLFREVIDAATDTHAYVCVKRSPETQVLDGDGSNVIVVMFRGTVTSQNVKTDMDTTQVDLPATDELKFEDANRDWSGIRVHKGFLESYLKIQEGVMDAVLQCAASAMNNGSGPAPKVYVTGHSLGGALAQLFSLDLACNRSVSVRQGTAVNNNAVVGMSKRLAKKARRNSLSSGGGGGGAQISPDFNDKDVILCQFPIACYTYGQPRVGNALWSRYFAKCVPHCFRVVAEGDVFVTVPKAAVSLRTFSMYKHTGTEVVLDDAATGTVCVAPTAVESTFRFSKGYYSIQNHSLVKYRKCLEMRFDAEELEVYYRKQQRGEVPEWLLQR